MNASVAVRNLLRVPLEPSTFYQRAPRRNGLRPYCWEKERAAQIRQIVKQSGLTIVQLSAATRASYGEESPFFIPTTFLYKQKRGVTPHLCQIVALSHVTGYRFADCMRICGFDLRLIFALQLQIHVERTILVTPGDTADAFRRHPDGFSGPFRNSSRRFLFAKIGSRDAVMYPTISPGSVVRADRCYPAKMLCQSATGALWLVEHPGGLTCCDVKRVDNKHILLGPSRPPLPPWPLCLGREARVLGLVDMEFRPREVVPQSVVCSTKFEHRPIAPGKEGAASFSTLVRVSRSRAGLTLRAARDLTLAVARLLGNRDYGIALGQLSDYEATDRLPRHVAKVMSLCIVYGIDPLDLMASARIQVDDSDKAPLLLRQDAVLARSLFRSDLYFAPPRNPESSWQQGNKTYETGTVSRARIGAASSGS